MENRFEGAIWYNEIKKYNAVVAGLGATGTYFSFLLARAGIKSLDLVDFDQYELHNVGSQLVTYDSIGKNKADAASQMLRKMTSIKNIEIWDNTIQNYYYLNVRDIIISATDSMDARKYMYQEFKKADSVFRPKLFLDSRIGAEYYEVYCLPQYRLDYIEKYTETLFDEAQGNVGACNYQQSSHSANMAACEMVKLVTNHITNNIMEDTHIPYKITHDLRTNHYEVYY